MTQTFLGGEVILRSGDVLSGGVILGGGGILDGGVIWVAESI